MAYWVDSVEYTGFVSLVGARGEFIEARPERFLDDPHLASLPEVVALLHTCRYS